MNAAGSLEQDSSGCARTLIVVLGYESREDLLGCLVSLEKADLDGADVLVVDNASSDGTAAAVRERHGRVKVLENSENLGFAAGNNVGIRCAIEQGYAYVLLLNPDVEVAPGFLGPLRETLETDSRVASVQARLLDRSDPTRIDSLGHLVYSSGLALEDRDPAGVETREIFGACAAAALYRTEVLREIGGFDPDLFIIYEDVDLSWRVRLAGYRSMLAADAIVYHARGASRVRGNGLISFYYKRNFLALALRYVPAHHLRRHALMFGYKLARVLAYALHHGRLRETRVFLSGCVRARRLVRSNPRWPEVAARWLSPPP